MKKLLIALVVALMAALPAAADEAEFTRFSNNPLGPLTIVASAMGEDTDTAQNTIVTPYKKQISSI